MKKLFSIRSFIGIAIISYSLFLIYDSKQEKQTNSNILGLIKPTQSVLQQVKPIATLVTNDIDRIKLAIFNYEFAKRIKNYDIDTQQLNDLYVLAASSFFKDSIDDKYDGLDEGLIGLISKITSDKNHKLTEQEKSDLSEYFFGLSWSLTQK